MRTYEYRIKCVQKPGKTAVYHPQVRTPLGLWSNINPYLGEYARFDFSKKEKAEEAILWHRKHYYDSHYGFYRIERNFGGKWEAKHWKRGIVIQVPFPTILNSPRWIAIPLTPGIWEPLQPDFPLEFETHEKAEEACKTHSTCDMRYFGHDIAIQEVTYLWPA